MGGKQVVAEVGGTLSIVSPQDSSSYSSEQHSSGGSISLCIPPLCYGASSLSVSESKFQAEGNFASVTTQSGIQAGDGGFQINVKGNTDLQGAAIVSTEAAVTENKNSLTTGTLTTASIDNHDAYEASGYSVSVTVAGRIGDQTTATSDADKRAANTPGKNSIAPGIGSVSGEQSSTTGTTISGGTITLTDSAAQAQTGQDAATVLATVDREGLVGTTTSNALTQAWDGTAMMADVQAQTEITAAFGPAASTAWGEFANQQFVDAVNAKDEETASCWASDGACRAAGHAIIGGATGGVDGAVSAAASSMVTQHVVDFWKSQGISAPAAAALTQLTMMGMGDAVGGTAGAVGALNEVSNNGILMAGAVIGTLVATGALTQCFSSQACTTALRQSSEELLTALQSAGSDTIKSCLTSAPCVAPLTLVLGPGGIALLAGMVTTEVVQPLPGFEPSPPLGPNHTGGDQIPTQNPDDNILTTPPAPDTGPIHTGGNQITDPNWLDSILWEPIPEPAGATVITSDGGANTPVTADGTANAATVPRLAGQLSNENLSNIAAQDPRLASAVNGSGTSSPNFSIGSGTSSEADALGKIWVGDGARQLSGTSGGWISADGTRVYRPPTAKPNTPAQFNPTGVQANFQRRDPVTGATTSNGHMVIK